MQVMCISINLCFYASCFDVKKFLKGSFQPKPVLMALLVASQYALPRYGDC